MKAQRFLRLLPLFALSLFASSVVAQNEIAHNDHAALARHYENLAKEVEAKLQENKAIFEEYEAHTFYYGRQGQDLHSHTFTNIREYEKILKESLSNADLHRKMAMGQDNPINKTKLNGDRDSTVVR